MHWSRAGRRLFLVAAASASVASIVPMATADAGQSRVRPCPSCNHNLIANPGAEKGKGANSDIKVKVPGWKQAGNFTETLYTWSGGDVSPTTPGPKHRGKNYFYGGPDAAKSTGTQVIKVAARGISGGKVRFTLSGWLGGFDGQSDNAVLTVTFDNSKGKAIGSAHIGPVTEAQRKGTSEMLFRSRAGRVPAGTRSIRVKLVMTRTAGSDNDGLADNLSLVLKLR